MANPFDRFDAQPAQQASAAPAVAPAANPFDQFDGKPAETRTIPPVSEELPGQLHLNPPVAMNVPQGALRPFAPGEFLSNPDDSTSNEISVTVQHQGLNGGKPTLVPSLWLKNGKPVRLNEDAAAEAAAGSGLKFPSFNSFEDADKFAADRETKWQGISAQDSGKVPALFEQQPVVGAQSANPFDQFDQQAPAIQLQPGVGRNAVIPAAIPPVVAGPPMVPSGEHGYTPQDLNPHPPHGDDYSPLDLPKQTLGKVWQDIKTLDPNTLNDVGSAVMAVPQMVAEPIGNAIAGEAGRNVVGATLEGLSAIPDLNLLHGITEKPPSNAVLDTAAKKSAAEAAAEAPKQAVVASKAPIEPVNVAQQPKLPPAEAVSAPKAVPPHDAAPEASAPLQPAAEPPKVPLEPVQPRQQPGDQPAPPGVAENTAAPIPPNPPAVDPAVEAARRRDAAASTYEGGQGTFSNTVATHMGEQLPVDEFGFVKSDKGGPIIFKGESQAQKWIDNVASKTSPGQELSVEPHPGGNGFTVAEAAKVEPDLSAKQSLISDTTPPAGDAFKAPTATDDNAVKGPVEPVQGTGETKVRGVSASIEAKAIEDGLTKSFGDLPEYETLNKADQARKALDFVNSDYEAAKAVAMGRALPPKGLYPESVMLAVEKVAKGRKDLATLHALGTSSHLIGEATEMGRRIGLHAERDPQSVVGRIKSVVDSRVKALKKQGIDVQRVIPQQVRAASNFVKQTRPTRESWAQFINRIKCK